MKANKEAKLLLKGVRFEPINTSIEFPDDVYTLKQFINACESKAFIDSDGSGEYAIDGLKARNREVMPSDIVNGDIDYDFTHVVWYNK